ncbi:MAG: hypothetical protein ILO68_05620 [Clostridia bacterium]|nr:hypothetical protein [Clostridia bacterium]
MRNHRLQPVRALLLGLCLFALAVALLPVFASADATVRFTEQPKGGTAINYSDFVVTWKTEPEVRVMLQTRSSETEDWGNVEWITSPWALNERNFTSQYRLSAEVPEGEVVSDVFTVSWVKPDQMTSAVVSVDDFPALPLGYEECPLLPVTVTNTGACALTDPFFELTDTSVCDLIQNREPEELLPGESDSVTWSIRLWPGLGVGSYECGLYLHSPNLDPENDPCRYVAVEVLDSGAEITYEMACDPVFFGRLEAGYPEQDTFDLTVRNVGTGNLTNVHLYTDDANTDFFHLTRNLWTVEQLNAGTNTGSSWYVRLNGGLDPGVYETQIKVYADELAEPLLVTLRAEIVGQGQGGETGSEDGETGPAPEASGETEVSGAGETVSSDPGSESVPSWVWIVVAAAAVLLIAVVVLTVVLLTRSRRK